MVNKENKIISSKPVIDVTQIIVLELALRCERYIKLNKLKEVVELTEILQALVKGVLKATDPHSLQVKNILNEALEEGGEYIKTEDFKALKQEVTKMTNAMHLITELEKPIKEYKCEVRGFF